MHQADSRVDELACVCASALNGTMRVHGDGLSHLCVHISHLA